MSEAVIRDVTDTALWVAVYRAQETLRPDALFHDDFAGLLAGGQGENIAATMGRTRLVSWMIVVRTCLIDAYVKQLVTQGVDTFLNLGAGLDTRPYRLPLPPSLRWIEVDYPAIIDLKETRLRGKEPRCKLERVRLDLADRAARKQFFAEVSSRSGKVAILTEGVVPYLTNEDVASLADDLRALGNFSFWIVDYFDPALMRIVRLGGLARRRMKNAPFQFRPGDPLDFYGEHGWKERETRYLTIEAEKLGRPFPAQWWTRLLLASMSNDRRRKLRGDTLLEPAAKP
jgi:methyltransferase (TIGR00027 family)